ncbi:neutral protease [Verticillium alfalfae VaMs.102]|uniref:deuterolysin n=1 Tax=Verticillium alfalfae (strain VaMs.102 / ATCC MYA-4576 / FGSC 10136) TaxID=526221 RepID=C9S6A1_VERA1|nr:neutral protease [Verticillium alfalfae VaMs.102]EEY14413.1 neutral protease [Verticillium alfalfae VaMs.102]
MKVLVAISSLALLAQAASVDLSARATPLVVRLEESGNSGIKGYLTNAGKEAVKLLTLGTFLDDRPVEKVEVFSGAIQNCAKLATAARTAAQNTNSSSKSRLQKYFKSSSARVSKQVSTVFGRIEKECSSTTSGVSSYHCTDVYNACRTGVIAYTLPSQSFMVNCRIFFDQMPPTDKRCHAQDQQTTILHEMTHLTEIAGTEDYGGYGFDFVRSLTPAQNLNHADTYTLFAQSIFARC